MVFSPNNISSIILAAGKGSRMQSELPKVLHCINGKPLLSFVIAIARSVGSEKTVVIVGHQAELIKTSFRDSGVIFAEQVPQMGTAHAVMQAKNIFENYTGDILILCGDVPLLGVSSIIAMRDNHIHSDAVVTVMTAILDDPAHYGRIVKNEAGEISQIVEYRDATDAQRAIKEINTGIYCVKAPFLFDAIFKTNNNNQQKEYYLTDIIAIAKTDNKKAVAFLTDKPFEAMGINSIEELRFAEASLNQRGKSIL
ncbi:MAG: sugar phosphate nucleotidyltransferase [Deltaproteobacteria bacterium]